MTLELTRYCFTTADYDRMIEAGILDEDDRVELIEGEIVEMTPIGRRHFGCVNRLNYHLSALAADTAQISVQNPIVLGESSEPQPDVVVLKSTPDFYSSGLPTPRDILLLVEVADSSVAIDRQIKIPLYARHGIAEVWLVDLEANLVTTFREPHPTGYANVRDVRRGERLVAMAFPSRELAVSDILG
ncbi:MAG TPA: Uma2 family endonuclease [Chloroflexota bacterium]|nr:Uma2 family endonuclease [Chloroflexota bacterium]